MSKHLEIYDCDDDYTLSTTTSVLVCTKPPSRNRKLILPPTVESVGTTIMIKRMFGHSATWYVVCVEGEDNLDGRRNGCYNLSNPYECVTIRCIPAVGWIVIASY